MSIGLAFVLVKCQADKNDSMPNSAESSTVNVVLTVVLLLTILCPCYEVSVLII